MARASMLVLAAACTALCGASYIGAAAPRQAHTTPQRARHPVLQLPFFQANVPKDQQPTVEMQNLRREFAYDWADSDAVWADKLRFLYGVILLFFSLPISYTTFYQLPDELPQLLIAANIGTLPLMLLFVLRLRVGWGFVSSRLRQRSTYYEADQTGFTAKKDRETLTRDRLIEKTQVSPILRRIDSGLLTVLVSLVLTLAAGEVVTVLEGEAGPVTLKTLTGDEARRFDNRLKGDDAFAAEEQRRARSRAGPDGDGLQPTYCNSRYYKILAGGNSQGGVGCGGSF